MAADVIGSGSEQAMLLPMIEQSKPYREDHTLITADAGYHSDANVQHLKDHNIPALIANNGYAQYEKSRAKDRLKRPCKLLWRKNPAHFADDEENLRKRPWRFEGKALAGRESGFFTTSLCVEDYGPKLPFGED